MDLTVVNSHRGNRTIPQTSSRVPTEPATRRPLLEKSFAVQDSNTSLISYVLSMYQLKISIKHTIR